MLKLKKLQILGFKSFCDRTDLRFQGEGIAAIVGPNGCGKSNISDAISWVLGEQSARLLRGVHMQDVIFAGTRDRKPTGMAEVSLTLVDPEVYGDVTEPEIDIQDDLPDDWDESAMSAERAADVERYSEEVRPGQGDEEVPAKHRSPSRRRKPRRQFRTSRTQDPPPKIQAHLQGRRNPDHTPPVPLRRKRISAERQDLPPARHSGHVYGNRLGPDPTRSSSRDASGRSSAASPPIGARSSKKLPGSPSTRRRSAWPRRAWKMPS